MDPVSDTSDRMARGSNVSFHTLSCNDAFIVENLKYRETVSESKETSVARESKLLCDDILITSNSRAINIFVISQPKINYL